MANFVRITMLATILIFSGTLVTPAKVVYAHGGKAHSDSKVTPLAAVQKAAGLFDKLVSKGKLDASWEINLRSITVYSQQRGAQWEWVVKFYRTEGTPEAVYIFLDSSGEYTGSNFTGQ